MRQFMVTIAAAALLSVFFVTPTAHASVNSRAPEVRVYDAKRVTLENSFMAFDESFQGGGTVATGDLDCDGSNEIIVGAGPGGGPQVRIFDGDGTPIRSFFVFPEGFKGGVHVATGDLNGDCRDEIIVGPGQGGGPYVRYMSQYGVPVGTPGFFAYAENFRGGVQVAAADVNGDGKDEVITAPGVGGGPQVRVFNRFGVATGQEFFPFAARDRGGVSIAAANVDGGLEDELVFAIRRFGRARVKVYKTDVQQQIVGLFEGWPEAFQGGLNVAGGDLDGDGYDELLASVASGGGPQVRGFEGSGQILPQNFFPYESEFRGGVSTAIGDIDGDGRQEIITIPGRNTIQGRTDQRKYIEVNLTEQRLYAYENGYVSNTFLISSGIAKYPTPEGTFSVLAKIPLKDYEWSYGPGHPDNYDIKDVADNLRFYPNFYLHSAFWHHNFGHPMSHGCVNILPDNARWLYAWAGVGISVYIHS